MRLWKVRERDASSNSRRFRKTLPAGKVMMGASARIASTGIASPFELPTSTKCFVPDGLQPGEQVQAEVFGYYLHTPNETLYTVEYTTEGDKFVNTYSIRTLHVEDLFEVLYLTGADAVAGATPVAFAKPEK